MHSGLVASQDTASLLLLSCLFYSNSGVGVDIHFTRNYLWCKQRKQFLELLWPSLILIYTNYLWIQFEQKQVATDPRSILHCLKERIKPSFDWLNDFIRNLMCLDFDMDSVSSSRIILQLDILFSKWKDVQILLQKTTPHNIYSIFLIFLWVFLI